MQKFFEMANRLGHDVAQLQNGETFDHTVTVNNIDELKALHDNQPASIRSVDCGY
jgi:hypothetical protein